jgi:hypothetical protein
VVNFVSRLLHCVDVSDISDVSTYIILPLSGSNYVHNSTLNMEGEYVSEMSETAHMCIVYERS